MSVRESFDDALDRAIDALNHGEDLERVLARSPHHAHALRPLLETARQATREARMPAPMSPRLVDHFSIVRAAVRRVQVSAPSVPERGSEPRPAWWQRRLTFASLSLPAGVFALLAVAGVSGAAASIAVTGDISAPSAVIDLARAPQHWLPGAVDDGDRHSSGDDKRDATGANGQAAGGGASAPAATGTATVTPGSENRPTRMTLDGTISEVHGNVFTLTTADGVYKVNVDGTTKITGTIADGAIASATGDVTAEKNVHADTVTVENAGTSQPATSDAAGTPTPASDDTPAPPSGKTPGPPADHTPGPPADHTPPGQAGNGNGNANGGGNGKKP